MIKFQYFTIQYKIYSAIIALMIFLLQLKCFSQEIPSERVINWKGTGLSSEVIMPEKIVNVMDFGAVGDGITDDYLPITNAILSLNYKPGIIYFPKGKYFVSSSIIVPSYTVLRGCSADSTKLLFCFQDNNKSCITISGKDLRTNTITLNNYIEPKSKLIRIDSLSNINKGDYVIISQKNDIWDVKPAIWAENAVGQLVRINDISDNFLTLSTVLQIQYDTSLKPTMTKVEPVENAGIEYLSIERISSDVNGTGSNIYMANAVNCWVKGVESVKSMESHISMYACLNCEISGCYIHDAYRYDGSSTRGYGVLLNKYTSYCLVTNNIFKKLRHAMILKAGANCNVVSYNYSVEPFRTENISDASGDICLHGHYPQANLFEGNIVQNIVIDHYWGPSGRYNTFFRNRAELYGIIMTNSDYSSNYQNFIENEITNKDLFKGFYTLTGKYHYEYGNYVKGNIKPAGSQVFSTASLYLEGNPDFWECSSTFPSIGYPNKAGTGSNPARDRFYLGKRKTIYPYDDLVSNHGNGKKIKCDIFPNPFTTAISVRLYDYTQSYSLLLLDQNGKVIINQIGNKSNKFIFINNLKNIPEGIYLLKIQTNNGSETFQMIKKTN